MMIELKTQSTGSNADSADTWGQYIQYLRDWADAHTEPGFLGTSPACYDEWHGNEYQELLRANDGYNCCLHDTPRTFDWCEENCERYYRCDTVAWAMDEQNDEKADDDTDNDAPDEYTVTITETLRKSVTVKAGSQCEAEEIVQAQWDDEEHVLHAGHFTGVQFEAVPVVD